MADAVGQPDHSNEHSDPADISNDAADGSIVLQDSPLREQRAPIVFTAAKQRKRLIAGIRHVSANIRKVFEKPETAKGKTRGFASKEEIRRAEERHEELAEGSAENHQCFAEPSEKEMAAFVDNQIDVIEKEKTTAVEGGVKKEERIEAQPANPSDTGNRLPGTEAIFEKRHKLQRNKSSFSRVLKKRR